jgi:hypothetical protein
MEGLVQRSAFGARHEHLGILTRLTGLWWETAVCFRTCFVLTT